MEELNVPVSTLQPSDYEGWFTKCGGSFATFSWKRRWGVLKGNRLWYYAGMDDEVAKGYIELGPGTVCQEAEGKKKKNLFTIQGRGIKHANRVFSMYTDTPGDMNQWITAIRKNVAAISAGNNPSSSNTFGAKDTPASSLGGMNMTTPSYGGAIETSQPAPTTAAATTAAPGGQSGSPVRTKVTQARDSIPFVTSGDPKLIEFWQIWYESIPARSEINDDQSIQWDLAVSSDCTKLSWRTSGPQDTFIQKMVDFFWNVGAPESEIDRLNDVGASINPIKIGSWIDMSAQGGMDGGWFFPVDVMINLVIEAGDPGEPSKVLTQWCAQNGITQCFSVGRDMGAAPPRQTEARMQLPGSTFEQQYALACSAFSTFGFPSIPDNLSSLINEHAKAGGLMLSVVTSSEGFVRIGLLIPNPSREFQAGLADATSGRLDILSRLEGVLCKSPSAVEFQYLNRGFGYGVYKEGFDVIFHYNIGEERQF